MGQLTFLTLSCLTATAFFSVYLVRGARIRASRIDLPIVAGLALVALQVAPLSPDLIASLSPEVPQLLPTWGSEQVANLLPEWNTLSLSPYLTWKQLGILASGWLLLIVARHRLNEPYRLAAFLDLTTISLCIVAVFGLLQLAFDNGRFFWFYEYPMVSPVGVARGPFSNPNQFGGCLSLAIPWPLWRIIAPIKVGKDEFGRTSSIPVYASMVAVSVLLPTILLTQSRVAIVCTFVAISGTIAMTMLFGGSTNGRGEPRQHRTRIVLLLAAMAGMAVAALGVFGDRLEADIERNVIELSSGDLEQLDYNASRRSVWSTAIKGSADFPLLGAGLGAHGTLYPRYWEGPVNEKWFSHVENGSLQMLLETGWLGLGMTAVVIGLAAFSIMRSLRNATKVQKNNKDRKESSDRFLLPVMAVSLVVLAVNCAETVTDFIWHVPGVMAIVVCIVAGSVGVASTRASEFGPRIVPIFGLMIALGVGGTFGPAAMRNAAAEPHWHRYVSLSRTEEPSSEVRILQLKTLLRANNAAPDDPQIHSALAKVYMWAFDFGQKNLDRFSLTDLRDVVRGGGWESVDEVSEWMNDETVASGTVNGLIAAREHALHALAGAPLDMRAYLTVLKTNFLYDVRQDADQPFYDQMLAINPNSATIHFELGLESLRLGDLDEAHREWKQAYDSDRRIRTSICRIIASTSSGDDLLKLIEPDAVALESIDGLYNELLRPEEERKLDIARAKAWELEAADQRHSLRRIHLLRKSCDGFEQAGELAEAERIAREAVKIGPADIVARRMLGEVLRTSQKWDEAAEHLIWCSKVKGDDSELRRRAKECLAMARESREKSILASPIPLHQYR